MRKRWMLGAALLMTCFAVPARADSQVADANALERRLVDLRWELHELTYSDVGTAAQREAKRLELCAIENRLRGLRSAPRLTAASAETTSGAVVAELPATPAESAGTVVCEPSPVLVTPALRTVAAAPDRLEPQA